jgi:hypothetical protein
MLRLTTVRCKKLLSAASLSSLIERHQEFLGIARNVGDGEIQLFEHSRYLEIVLANTKKLYRDG